MVLYIQVQAQRRGELYIFRRKLRQFRSQLIRKISSQPWTLYRYQQILCWTTIYLQEFTVNSEGLTLHILKGIITAEISKSISESENLNLFEPINMVVMNWDDRIKSITTEMIIEITETTIICKSGTTSKSDQACIKYLLQIAKKSNHIFATSISEYHV